MTGGTSGRLAFRVGGVGGLAARLLVAAAAVAAVMIGRQGYGVTLLLERVTTDAAMLGLVGLVTTALLIGLAAWWPVRLPPAVREGAVWGTVAAAVVIVFLGATGNLDGGGDARILFDHRLPDPYDASYEQLGFAYSPTVAYALYPAIQLPWTLFLGLWTALLLGALLLLAGPAAPLLMLAPLVALDVRYANVNLFLALAVAHGLGRPAWWAVVLHTKITPGLGILWFLVRRDLRRLALAIGATAALAAVSIVIAPSLWRDWIEQITGAASTPGLPSVGPLWLRVLLAGCVVVWGARTDRPWTVGLGAALAVPVTWPSTLTLLIALVPLVRGARVTGGRRAVDRALDRAAPAGS